MASSGRSTLTGEIHIDEFVMGGPEKGKLGRSDGKKKKTLVMVDVRPGNKMARVYCSGSTTTKSDALPHHRKNSVAWQKGW